MTSDFTGGGTQAAVASAGAMLRVSGRLGPAVADSESPSRTGSAGSLSQVDSSGGTSPGSPGLDHWQEAAQASGYSESVLVTVIWNPVHLVQGST